MKTLKLFPFAILILLFIIFIQADSYAQRNLYLQDYNKDSQIRSNQDTTTWILQQNNTANDAFIYSNDSTFNFGADTSGYIGKDTLVMVRGVGRGLFQTDSIRNYIPEDAKIIFAGFKVYRDTLDTNAVGSGIADLHQITNRWTEGTDTGGVDTVNWVQRLKANDGGPADWDSAGGAYNTIILDSVNFTSSTDSLDFGSTDSLVAMVQRWIDGVDSVFGILIKTRAETADVYFPIILSDDTVNTAFRPVWTIKYTLPYNYGANTTLYVGYDTLYSDSSRVLIENDSIQGKIPSNATITESRLALFNIDNSLNVDSGWVYLHSITSSWSEGSGTGSPDTVNWLRRLKGGDTLWATAGGDYSSTIMDSFYAKCYADSVIFEGDSLSAQIQRWVDGTDENNGVLVKSDENTHFKWVMVSSDDTMNADYGPIWDIWYTVPIDTGIIRPLSIYAKNDSGYLQWVDEGNLIVQKADTSLIALDTAALDYPDITITVSLTPEFPGWTYSLISANLASGDTNMSVLKTGNNVRTGLDTSWFLFECGTVALDSIGAKLHWQLPSDFESWNADSAIVVWYNIEYANADSNYIELDIFKQGSATVVDDNAKVATAVGWNKIIITASDLSSGNFAADNEMVLIFTIGARSNCPLKIYKVRFRYER